MYFDKRDGKIDGDFHDKMAGQWHAEQRRLRHDIAGDEEAEQSSMGEGVRSAERARSVLALSERQPTREKRRQLNFVLSNCAWENGEVAETFCQPFDLWAIIATIADTASADSGGNSSNGETWLGR